MALGRITRLYDRGLPFIETLGEPGWLSREFGPSRETSEGYPFQHPVTDGTGTVTRRDGGGHPGTMPVREIRAAVGLDLKAAELAAVNVSSADSPGASERVPAPAEDPPEIRRRS
jgi:putative restriction endonuclease